MDILVILPILNISLIIRAFDKKTHKIDALNRINILIQHPLVYLASLVLTSCTSSTQKGALNST